jgi:SAM-dependent MidA family methyltransferase
VTALRAELLEWIAANGPMPFDRFVDRALYDPAAGFYATAGRAGGRRGDFVTSAEVGPLFAAVIADWLDAGWRAVGEPAEFRVAEAGAGVGTLFRGIHRARPACLDALVYTLVERSPSQRHLHETLPGSSWHSVAGLPEMRQHVIVANELLDNLPFGIAERSEEGWAPVRVVAAGGRMALEAGDVDAELEHLARRAPTAAVGARVPVAVGAAVWLADALATADRLLAFDYGASTAELAERGQAGWLRTYRTHERGSDPLADVGSRDITHDVPFDQLPTPTSQTAQAGWLAANGIEDRVAAARATWHERAHIGDLAAIAARSAVGEAEALTDPTGLGSFQVLEWHPTTSAP